MRVIALVVLMMVGGVVQADNSQIDKARETAKPFYHLANKFKADSGHCLGLMKVSGRRALNDAACEASHEYIQNITLSNAALEVLEGLATLPDDQQIIAFNDMIIGDFISNYTEGVDNYNNMAKFF